MVLMNTISAADIRAGIARRNVPRYVLAARIRIHPMRLGRLLNGRLTLTPELAQRVMHGLNEAPPA
jgi:plasmid maintenance system antidote protein VapI